MLVTKPTLASSPPAGPDPLRQAAADLHTEFIVRMLEDAGLTEAMGAAGKKGEAPALAGFALQAIAEDVAGAQPALTERLYQAMRRAG